MTQQDRSAERSGSDLPDAVDDDASIEDTGNVSQTEPVDLTVESRAHGWRLDHYLSRLFGNHSRAQLQRAIESGQVTLNGLNVKPSRRLRVNDRIHMALESAEERHFLPEDVPLDIIYEDDALVVVIRPRTWSFIRGEEVIREHWPLLFSFTLTSLATLVAGTVRESCTDSIVTRLASF